MSDTSQISALTGHKVRQCEVCRAPFQARLADIKRGWAKTCSKSCAATRKNAKLSQKGRGVWRERSWQDAAAECFMDYEDREHGDKQ